jgi:hypothetical protein
MTCSRCDNLVEVLVSCHRRQNRSQRDASAWVDHRVSNGFLHNDRPAWKERTMIEPNRHEVVGFSPLPGNVVHKAEGRCAS